MTDSMDGKNHSEGNTIRLLDHIRLHPDMYADPNKPIVMTMLKEVIDNCVDEHIQGFGNQIIIGHEDGAFSVRDYGRGIPFDRLFQACTSLDIEQGKRNTETLFHSIGLSGLGLKLVNALSSVFSVTTFRNGKACSVSFQCGVLDKQAEEDSGEPDGTLVRFMPDGNLAKAECDGNELWDLVRMYAYLNSNLVMELNGRSIHATGGLRNLVEDLADAESGPVIHYKDEFLEYAYAFMDEIKAYDQIFSFVNRHRTTGGGPHHDAFRKFVVDLQTDRPVIAAISVSIRNPVFTDQSKAMLQDNIEIERMVGNEIARQEKRTVFLNMDEETEADDIEAVGDYLKAGFHPFGAMDLHGSPFITSIESLRMVRLLVGHGLDLNTSTWSTTLAETWLGKCPVLELEASIGFLIERKDALCISSMSLIAPWFSRLVEIPECKNLTGRLLEKVLDGLGASPKPQDMQAVLGSCNSSKFKYARMLMEHGYDINSRDCLGSTCLHLLLSGPVQKYDIMAVLHFFIDNGVDINIADRFGETPVSLLVRNWRNAFYDNTGLALPGERTNPSLPMANYPGLFRQLVACGARLDGCVADVGCGGLTLLMIALGTGSPDAVRTILATGPDLEAVDQKGHTAFDRAMISSGIECVRLLADAGADFSHSHGDVAGRTPLMLALEHSYKDSEEKVRLLVGRNVDANVKDRHGRTAMMFACRNCRRLEIPLLLAPLSDCTCVDEKGAGILDYLGLNKYMAYQDKRKIRSIIRNQRIDGFISTSWSKA